MIDTEKLYEIALQLYEDDYHQLAINVFHDAMKRQPPTLRHLDFLETSERIAKTAFYRDLRERYPDSWEIKFAQANNLYSDQAIKMYTELLENMELEEVDKRRIRFCRLKINCNRRNADYEVFKEDFFYFWYVDPDLVSSQSKMRQTILRMLTLGITNPHAIPTLKRLINEPNLDEQARKIIQSKIALMELVDDFR